MAILTGNGVTFPDNSIQASASNYIMRTYTSNATWTKPAGLKAIKVTVVGPGGAGGWAGDSLYNTPYPTTNGPPIQAPMVAGGGGGGGAAIGYITGPNIPGPVSVVIGAGGYARTPTFGTNPAGPLVSGTSNFGNYLFASGGGLGNDYPAIIFPLNYAYTNGGSAGYGYLGPLGPSVSSSVTLPGQGGSPSINTLNAAYGAGGGGAGGASALFAGTSGAAASRNFGSSSGGSGGYGAGGAGGALYWTPTAYIELTRAGGSGRPGVVIVEEFYA